MDHGEIFLLIRIAVFLLTLLIQVFVFRNAAARWSGSDRAQRHALAALFALMNLPGAFIAFANHVSLAQWFYSIVIPAYMLWQFASVAFIIWNRLSKQAITMDRNPMHETDASRRAFLFRGASGLTIIASGGALTAFHSEEDYEIVRQTIRLPNLSPKLKGLRIAMISDIHSGPYMSRDQFAPYIGAVNRLKPDVILLPGDFVQNRDEEVEPVAELVRKLEAPYGVYGTTGNHEYFADADFIAKELSLAGVRMLRNEHVVLDARGEKFALIGIDDVRRGFSFDSLVAQAVRGFDATIPNILLCHKPYYLEDAASWGINFMVSGHTHGGQIVLARVFNTVITPAALISGYVEGLYRFDATKLYVTRGIDTVGIPVRFNCPPEVTLFTLNNASR